MKKIPSLIILTAFLALPIVTVQLIQAEKEPKLQVVTTIYPLTEMVREIAGDRAEVLQIIPASADIHHFQLRPGDLRIIMRAKLFVAVGEKLEPWLNKIENSMGQIGVRTIKFIDYLRSIDYQGLQTDDPHVWLDFQADCLLVKKIVEELTFLDPGAEKIYQTRGKELLNKLSSLDEQYRTALSGCQQKYFIVAGHRAFGYLAGRYGLNLVSLTGPNPESQPSPRRLQEIVNLIRSSEVRAIFVENSSSPAYAQTIARETGAKLNNLSTGVNLTRMDILQKRTFWELMAGNLETLKKALGCEGK